MLELRGVTKRFPGVLANDRIDFSVHGGEIHALLGENGAGKSTLMKQLYGLYKPDEGTMTLDGEPFVLNSPADALARGIGMVHQHFMLVDTLTVAENVALGLRSTRGPLTDLKSVSERIREISARYGLRVDPDAVVWQLSVGEQQRVEIVKALVRGAALLILDEPTAVLTPGEVDEFFGVMRGMAAEGHAVVFISHKLGEVVAFTDRVTVLRDGRTVGEVVTAQTSTAALAQLMVSRPLAPPPARREHVYGDAKLTLQNLSVRGERGVDALTDVSLTVRAGEIMGLAGVSGSGQLELAEAVAGLRACSGGRVLLGDADVTLYPVAERIARGLSYVPEERNRDGMIRDFSVADNLILRESGTPPYANRGFLDFSAVRRAAGAMVEQFAVKTPSTDTPIKNLSGGNAQKVIFARELGRKPGVFVAAQPTRGVDIGAAEFLRAQLVGAAQAGSAVLLISEDLDELLALSHRVAVIFHGRIMGVLDRDEATLERIGLLIAGEKLQA